MVPFEYKPPIENTTRASREPPPLNNLSTCPHKCCVFWLFSWIILVFLSGRIALAAAAAKSLQSCPTLCDPRDGSPPGSPVPGILQARTLEWVAISFSNAWKWKVKVKSLNCVRLLATPWTAVYQAPPSVGFSRQENWSGVPLPFPKHGTRTKYKENIFVVWYRETFLSKPQNERLLTMFENKIENKIDVWK